MMRKILIPFVLLCLSFNYSYAQEEETTEKEVQNDDEKKSEIVFGADIVNRYIWRGLDLGSAPAIQPYFFWNKAGFSIGTWGSYSFNGNFAEADIMASYNYKFITVGLTDFFFPVEGFNVNNQYFNYKSGETTHALEASVKFTGPENLPFNFLIGTVFYGADLDANLDNVYSTYLELMYPFSANKLDFEVFMGAVLNDEPNLYADGAGVINMGFKASKPIKISDEYSMGAFFSLVVNPKYENIHLVFGLNF